MVLYFLKVKSKREKVKNVSRSKVKSGENQLVFWFGEDRVM